jgi:hypothetical protein
VPLCLKRVTVDGVRQFFRCVIAEMHRLAGIWTNARCNKHQPRQQLAPRLRSVFRQKHACLLGEIEQDRVAVEHNGIAINDGGYLRIRIYREILRPVLIALSGIYRDWFVRKPTFFE